MERPVRSAATITQIVCMIDHRPFLFAAAVFLAAPLTLSARGAEGERVLATIGNFALLDHAGKFHEVDYYRRMPGARGIVLFIQGNGCPLVQKRVPELKRLRATYQKRGVLFGMLSSYRKVKGWSDMIAEVVLTRQMPPWHADPEVGEFRNDCGLSPAEARTLVRWVQAGAPRGEGDDPLEGHRPSLPEWNLGEPDEVMTLPEQRVAAEGVFDYRYVMLDNPFDRDVWLSATEIVPGNSRVLHHVIVTAHHPSDEKVEKWITGYAPGTQGEPYPAGSAVMLPKGWKLKFQIHYTASGKEERDVTRLGLHLASAKPDREYKTLIIMNGNFAIPPGAAEYASKKSHQVGHDVLLYAINPHMHYRGKRMSFEVKYPDGRREMLLSVPDYNFNWQRTYVFAEPVRIPAGSRIEVRNAWDNSKLNPHNPDPGKEVRWGDQSFEEMFFATLGYVEE